MKCAGFFLEPVHWRRSTKANKATMEAHNPTNCKAVGDKFAGLLDPWIIRHPVEVPTLISRTFNFMRRINAAERDEFFQCSHISKATGSKIFATRSCVLTF